jgi:rhodanese-related sulfurtransferase
MTIKQITPQEAFEMANKGTLFVDVRELNETSAFSYDLKNIIYAPLSNFEILSMAKLPQDKSTTIILACRSGGRSMRAAEFLAGLGYTSLCNLSGGILGWSESMLPCKES